MPPEKRFTCKSPSCPCAKKARNSGFNKGFFLEKHIPEEWSPDLYPNCEHKELIGGSGSFPAKPLAIIGGALLLLGGGGFGVYCLLNTKGNGDKPKTDIITASSNAYANPDPIQNPKEACETFLRDMFPKDQAK